MNETFTVYILQSKKDFEYYTGLTKDLERRLREHNGGFVKPTKGRRPFIVIHTEEFRTLKEARQREKFYKTGEGRELRDSIVSKLNQANT